MRRFILLLFTACSSNAFAQTLSDSILITDVQKHLSFLASDSLKGRENYSPELHRAAQYIAAEFKASGAQFLPTLNSYYQPFTTEKIAADWLLPDSAGNYISSHVLLNVIGVLPGKTKPTEVILFTAHYDHVGGAGAGIFNGANDNASGTTAILTLLRYYAQHANNERTLIFCAFAGEEIGLKGSTVLSQIINPKSVKAMINIEMIGRHGAVGRNSFFITGGYKSNLAAHFKKVLKTHGIKVKQEPAGEKQLFMRSDNYPFALKGVPAHSIMSSDDEDACYHQTCDEIGRIDMPNMVRIIQAIVIGSRGLVDGTVTPSRIRL